MLKELGSLGFIYQNYLHLLLIEKPLIARGQTAYLRIFSVLLPPLLLSSFFYMVSRSALHHKYLGLLGSFK